MSTPLAQQTGSAAFWKGIQMGGVQVIFLARTLILARLLAPSDFGLLAIALVAVDLLVNVTNLGLIPALIQHPDPDENQYNVAWSVGITRSVMISVVIFLVAPYIAELFAEPRATILIRVMALRPLLSAAASIKVAALTRNLQFRTLAFLYLPEALGNTIVSVALAPWLGVWALVAGTLAGPAIYLVLSYILAPYRPRLSLDGSTTGVLMRFGRWIFLMSLVAVSGNSILQVVISRQLGAAELGLYYLAAKLAFMPADVASELIGAVAFPLYSRLQVEVWQITRVFRSIVTLGAAVLIPVSTLMIALAPSLVTHILGARWESTVPLIQVLAIVNVVGLFGDTVAPLLKGMGQPHKLFLVESVQSTLLVALAWSFTAQLGVSGAPLAWLVAVGASQVVSAVFISRMLPKPFAGLGRSLLTIVAVCVIGGTLARFLTDVVAGLPGFVVGGAAGALFIFGSLYFLDRVFSFGWIRDVGLAFPQVAAFMGQDTMEV